MGMVELTGHTLELGDRVRMNIEAIGKTDLDGVLFTSNGKDYWRYMNQHPDEVYTVTGFDFQTDENEVTYVLSGYMGDNNWYSSDLILVPTPQDNFEMIKNMTRNEMAEYFSKQSGKPIEELLAWLNRFYDDPEAKENDPARYDTKHTLMDLIRGKSIDTEQDLAYVVDILIDYGIKMGF